MDTNVLYSYFDREDNLMGTFSYCLPLLIHNLEKFVSDLIINNNLDNDALNFDLYNKINYLHGQGIRIRGKTYITQSVISKELWELLNDLREQRNPSVHVSGYLYNKIMEFNNYYLLFNGYNIQFVNSKSDLVIKIPQEISYNAITGTHGIILHNGIIDNNYDNVTTGAINDHHFIIEIWTTKAFKENCRKIYAGDIKNDYVIVYYYGKKYSIYDIARSQCDKIKRVFNISGLSIPITIYLKFKTEYFLSKLVK